MKRLTTRSSITWFLLLHPPFFPFLFLFFFGGGFSLAFVSLLATKRVVPKLENRDRADSVATWRPAIEPMIDCIV